MAEITLNNLALMLEPYQYVVLRNFHNLPDSIEVDGHKDLDLFVCEEQANDLKLLLREFDWIDVRSPFDHYFPEEVQRHLLLNRRRHGDFYIPSPEQYFLSLYYHNAVHKIDDPYHNELVRAYLEIYPPVKCVDEGVGFDISRYYQE